MSVYSGEFESERYAVSRRIPSESQMTNSSTYHNYNSPSPSPGPEAQTMHELRSSFRYHSLEEHVPRPVALLTAFNSAYKPFLKGLPVPKEALEKLSQFTITSVEFYDLVTSRELERGRFIFLDEGRVKFDEATLPPHGAVIGEVIIQIGIQDRGYKLFIVGTADSMSLLGFTLNITDITLSPNSDKQPDGHWTINVASLPTPPPPGTFAINPATGLIAPQLVLEVAVSDETMPALVGRDLQRYFGPGTGTRSWVGFKIFKSARIGGVHRWWAGHATRRFLQGVFLDEAELSEESMAQVAKNDQAITEPTDKIFHIDVATLIHPCPVPPNYPATLNINLEEIRVLILSVIS
jgi:hypothetical protein